MQVELIFKNRTLNTLLKINLNLIKINREIKIININIIVRIKIFYYIN